MKNFSENPQSGSSIHRFQIELEFKNVSFCATREENRSTWRKPLGVTMSLSMRTYRCESRRAFFANRRFVNTNVALISGIVNVLTFNLCF